MKSSSHLISKKELRKRKYPHLKHPSSISFGFSQPGRDEPELEVQNSSGVAFTSAHTQINSDPFGFLTCSHHENPPSVIGLKVFPSLGDSMIPEGRCLILSCGCQLQYLALRVSLSPSLRQLLTSVTAVSDPRSHKHLPNPQTHTHGSMGDSE